jgi:pyridoxine 5-phosphate synthase
MVMRLSVNLNKVALLRNSRGGSNPSPLRAAEVCLDAGAYGLTLHWRQDNRHTRVEDVRELRALARRRGVEFNLEGDLRRELIDLAIAEEVTQCTLVPVTPGEITSNHGWDFAADSSKLRPVIERLAAAGIRTSVFVDAKPENMRLAAATGADRVEIYTEPYAAAFASGLVGPQLDLVRDTARAATECGLAVNAGHDLDLYNTPLLARQVPEIVEVSIGHALISDALYVGLDATVRAYVRATRGLDPRTPIPGGKVPGQ